MKKYFSLALSLLAVLAFTACTADEGTTPGGDSNPVVTIYTYEPAAPLNPDNDVNIRIAANGKTDEVYYLVEKSTEKESRNIDDKAYAQYVKDNGVKVDAVAEEHNGGKVFDFTLTDLYGEYTITAVAVKGGTLTSTSVKFLGLDWEDVVEGTYYFANPNAQVLLGMASNPTTLQVCTTDETLYRFKDVFGNGVHLKINLMPDYQATDAGGTYTFFRVADQRIGVQYQGNDVYVRDIGYWQGDDEFITEGGYESGMYDDYYCFICVQLHIGSTNYNYNYDEFVPND